MADRVAAKPYPLTRNWLKKILVVLRLRERRRRTERRRTERRRRLEEDVDEARSRTRRR